MGKARDWDNGKRKDLGTHKATELKCNSFDHRHVHKETTIEQPCRKALSLYHRTSTLWCPSKVSSAGVIKGRSWKTVCSYRVTNSGIMKNQWNSSHNWSAVMKGYRFLRKDSKKVRKGIAPSSFLLWECSNTVTGCQERLWSHRESKPHWKWATCSRWLCLSKQIGLVDLKSCLPTLTLLWSWGVQFHLIWFLIHLKYKSKTSPVTHALQLYLDTQPQRKPTISNWVISLRRN